MHNYQLIREFYALAAPAIAAAKPHEWAIDPYAWDTGLIQMTPIESWLWHDIRAADVVVYPQYPVEGFFVDFANPKAKVVIECDGKEFHLDKAKDAARDKKLTAAGWHVYRITGTDCRNGVGMEDEWNSKPRQLLKQIVNLHNIQRH